MRQVCCRYGRTVVLKYAAAAAAAGVGLHVDTSARVSSCVVGCVQADIEDQSNELKMAEDNAKRAMADAARLAEELRHEQEHAQQIERLRRALESQVRS